MSESPVEWQKRKSPAYAGLFSCGRLWSRGPDAAHQSMARMFDAC
jgi:hypothetical protein